MRGGDTLLKRIMDKVSLGHDHGCWMWFGSTRGGYGQIRTNGGRFGTTAPAHRVLYVRLVGEIPKGMVLDHICRNQLCVNPRHLRICTVSQNAMHAKKPTHNTSGHKGVSYDKTHSKWRAIIGINRKKIGLGTFATKEEAIRAYRNASEKYQGEFACWD